MKVTLNWLKQYVGFDWTPEELRERLTMLGLEVEGMQKLGGEFEGIVVAEVLTRDKHPNADKLSLCRVADGKGERQIVCGAQNFKPGDKVPLILPGASLPPKPGEKEPFTIKVGKIRGVESHGMLCSPKELGLSDDAQGLLILPPAAKVGQPFAEHLGRAAGDVVYDLEITPNRPDLNSVIGIAREISAVTGNPLRLPDVKLPDGGDRVEKWVAVRLEDPELCARYAARVVRGVRVGPSPDWLRQTLEKVGVRSISNVVDVTNYVMLEIGQPLHAFDYHLLGKGQSGTPTIVVRRAGEGEKFTTLDGQERALTTQNLLIADETKAIALAGVMGGQNTEINEKTVDVLIESAWFKPQNIRATSKRLELRTESSYRFERGADIRICDWASCRAAQLILETAGGELLAGVVDAFPVPPAPKEIQLRHRKTDELLGVAIPPAESVKHLRRLGLEMIKEAADACTVRVPTFRVDLKREADLIEEVARLYGVDKIPATSPRGAIGANVFDAVHDHIAEARRLLTGLGLSEAQGQTLVSSESAKLVTGDVLALENPLSADMNLLRPSLIPGLLDMLRHNLHRKNDDVALFELGRVFRKENGVREQRNVAFALTGRRQPGFWTGDDREATYDIFDLKGILEEFLEQFGVRGANYARRAEAVSPYIESAVIQLGGKLILGEIGQLSPLLAKRCDLRDRVLIAELNLDMLLARRKSEKSFKPLPAFPSIRRDVAMIVPESTPHESVLNTVKKLKPANLERVDLFDVFRGQNIPPGQKSMAYAFTYRNPERTLTDEEVNAAHEKVIEQFRKELQATIRD
ncbi:MAG: phenylalanine--tRNA ligase subunit beta [Verrucomicrobia subdivision 3 bacterium]|nr:phenylalanine--tRNA ligase subunit beta [Limisphaerales bacterium]